MSLRIRTVTPEDLSRCAAIESVCFPPLQAASPQAIERRIRAYGDHFLVAVAEGELIGYIMGPVIAQPYIADWMYADESCHQPDQPYQSVFSLAVMPTAQRRGVGGTLIHAMAALARQEGREAVTLNCREEKIPWYAGFGFVHHGLAQSSHGGVAWHNMVLPL